MEGVRRLQRRVRRAERELAEDIQAARDVRPVSPLCRWVVFVQHHPDDEAKAVQLVGEAGVEKAMIWPKANVAVAGRAYICPLEVGLWVVWVIAHAIFQ